MANKAVLDLLTSIEDKQEEPVSEHPGEDPPTYVDPDLEREAELLEEEEADSEASEEDPEEKPSEPPRRLPTFQATESSAFWRKLVKALGSLSDEWPVSFSRDSRIELFNVDPAHVAMCKARLAPHEVHAREWDPEEVPYGIDLEHLKNFLKGIKPTDTVTVSFEEHGDEGRFVLRSGVIEQTFSPMDGDFSKPKLPKLDLPAYVRIGAKELKDAVKAMWTVSDAVTLTADPQEGLIVSALTDGHLKKEAHFPKDLLIDLQVTERVRSHFPLDYLAKVLEPFTTEELHIRMGQDYPIRIDTAISADYGDECELIYMVAPRIQDD